MSTEYRLPPLPLGSPEAAVVHWLRQPGEPVTKGAPLLVVVNDRVEVALPAPDDGVLEQVCVAEGALAPGGALLARLGPLTPADPAAVPQTASEASGLPERTAAVRRRVSPVALRIASSAAIDLQSIAGSGPGGRVLKRDVLAALPDRPALSSVLHPLSSARHPLTRSPAHLLT
jgi:pyruvate dehydrogenase E2 component (dihydrolipoamide acetyltransferase)